jgi:DNA processing protein
MHCLGFSYFLGIGPVTFNILLNHFSTAEKAYTAKADKLKEVLGPKLTTKFLAFRETFDLKKESAKLKSYNITVLTREDTQYPSQFLNLTDAPICIYVKGNNKLYDFKNDFFFAIVGTRKPTSYGSQIARRFAYDLSKEGMIIVSGMAMGIDYIAHDSALNAHGKTIAILGCGVNIIYPPTNAELYNRILQNGGLIMSEFPPHMTVQPGLFVSRNRLISGLSRGVLVAEGMKDSGSLITARCAAEQGKDVFAPPAPITSEQSEAPNMLIKEGAKLVTSSRDILEEYDVSSSFTRNDAEQLLSSQEQKIYSLVSQEPYSSDEIARVVKLPIYQILPIVSELELKGVIEKNGEGKYQLVL